MNVVLAIKNYTADKLWVLMCNLVRGFNIRDTKMREKPLSLNLILRGRRRGNRK